LSHLRGLYRDSLSLLTDLYQLTMAYGYWKLGRGDLESVFHLSFRENPFEGGFSIACGLSSAVELIENFHFGSDDLEYLRSIKGNDQKPLFETKFLDFLASLKLTCDIDAIPEGTAVFPHEPLVRVSGPILQCQLLETPFLNLINFPTLIATKAARVCLAAQGDAVLEFGARRAQGIDGTVTASRAAYVGGCAGTSNVLAGKLFGIPVAGTHAHSWVMSFPGELEAFEAYAQAMPNNCTFLVDTYNTIEGVHHAAAVGRKLRARGHRLAGIRLDSGDLAYLSIQARRILDEAGFTDASIVASNDLDERLIESLKHQGAKINVWGVGTRLATAYDQPALGGVYKLSAIRDRADGPWQYKLKLSEQTVKVSTPGVLGVRRYLDTNGFIADAIYDVGTDVTNGCTIVDPADMTRRKVIAVGTNGEELLVPIFRDGQRVHDPPDVHAARRRTLDQLAQLHPTIKRFDNPHRYPVGLELSLHELKAKLILDARKCVSPTPG
jgi:nicotinate phosphoribosyltransferase